MNLAIFHVINNENCTRVLYMLVHISGLQNLMEQGKKTKEKYVNVAYEEKRIL